MKPVKKKYLTGFFFCANVSKAAPAAGWRSMDKLGRESLLYDFYGELLTKRQQEIYENVRFGDLSLSEAAASYGISRQGIHDMLRRADEALEAYEAKLGLVEKYLQDRKDGQKIRELAERIRNTGDMALLDGITALARQIEER